VIDPSERARCTHLSAGRGGPAIYYTAAGSVRFNEGVGDGSAVLADPGRIGELFGHDQRRLTLDPEADSKTGTALSDLLPRHG
jgi:hypothetical protein